MNPGKGFPVAMVLLLGVVMLTGCLTNNLGEGNEGPDGNWEPGPGRGCIGGVCLTDPEAPYARYVKEEYGLNIIVDSPTRLIPRDVDGDWAIFQTTTGKASWIVAYNFSEDRLMDVEGRGDYHMTRTHLVDERAVIYREPRGGEVQHAHMLMWDLQLNESRVLDTGMGGGISGSSVLGFDGQWVLFGNRGSPVEGENALWAMDVDTGELVKVYTPVLEPNEDGWEERMGSAGISHGRVFYSVRMTHPENNTRWSIGMMDVTTGEQDIVYEGSIGILDGPELAVGESHVAWDAGVGNGLWALDIQSRNVFKFSIDGEGPASPGIGGDWAVYRDSNHDNLGTIAVNLRTGERVEIRVELDREGFAPISFGGMTTDGSRVVGSLNVLSGDFALPHHNRAFPFWYDLDDHRESS